MPDGRPAREGDAPPPHERSEPGGGQVERGGRDPAFGRVLLLVVGSAALVIVAPPSRWSYPVEVAVVALTMLVALRESRVAARLRRFAATGAGLAILLAVAAAAVDAHPRGAASALCAALTVAAAGAILRRLLLRPVVDAQAVLGALTIYLLTGIFFAFLGLAAATFVEPYFAGQQAPERSDFFYFSFVTLTTVGYGDVAPGAEVARLFAVAEALLGQLYLVTVVALTVTNLGRPRRTGSGGRDMS
jgi:hypothetical protein